MRRLVLLGAVASVVFAAGGIVLLARGTTPAAKTERISVPWTLVLGETKDERLAVNIGLGGCMAFRDLVADETDTAVTITAFADHHVREGQWCSASQAIRGVRHRLRMPLGDRTVHHGAVTPGMEHLGDGLPGDRLYRAPGSVPEP